MKNLIIWIVVFGLIYGCGQSFHHEKLTEIQNVLSEIRQIHAPDKRVAHFDVEAKFTGENYVLHGETNLPEALTDLKNGIDNLNIKYIDSVKILPDPLLGDTLWGVVNNSVSNFRSQPKHSAELATQALLGMPVKLLKRQGDWYLAQTPDQYIAWIDYGGIKTMTSTEFQAWKSTEKIIFTSVFGQALHQLDRQAVVSDLVMGNVLTLSSEVNGYFQVIYPDGRTAVISVAQAQRYNDWLSTVNMSGMGIVNLASQFVGTPYLWGGTSTKGMDCSGFTKTVYFMHGLMIPRDASQQVHEGIIVDSTKLWSSLEAGDLMFFGRQRTDTTAERVVHVGIWVGNGQFLHASGDGQVRMSSIVPESAQYDKLNDARYLRSKRYIGASSKYLKSLRDHDLY